jgi:hypothetical protein
VSGGVALHGTLRQARCPLAAVLAISVLVSCTSLRPIRSDQVQTSLKAGDTVSIVTRDGRATELKIVAVTGEAIIGTDQRIALDDIVELQKREIHIGKTLGLVGAIVGAAVLVGLLVWLVAEVAAGAGAGLGNAQ